METTTYKDNLRNVLLAVLIGSTVYTTHGARITGGTYDASENTVSLTSDNGRVLYSGFAHIRITVEVA